MNTFLPHMIHFKKKYTIVQLIFLLALLATVNAQPETNQWKFQFALGLNSPIDNDKSDSFESKSLNFPSINLGIQHMLSRHWGARFDLGYNRARHDDNSPEFKFNYTRLNLQAIYDFYNTLGFLPTQMTVIAHAGPGLSLTKPLGSYSDNNYTYLNGLAGIELHYGIAPTVSVYTDLSYAFGFSGKDKYNPAVDGFSFNGDMMFISVGLSVSLSGCYFCD
ncbi:MAG: porin family protein [Bacteroidia bacterium]|nr:porin family protein [Bacteroidia bacterium]MBT8287443.1 porin family protein [Bacteroidia bacterium]NNF81825.1 outer membrane beta-barrel protein [Flavobacteriaceae bacterium]NNK72634.1 outer membrane beta-barrel protein [Flavobacteriaceae bacterium]